MARSLRLAPVVVISVALALGLIGCSTPPPTFFVALGDSYTAGPLIPNQSLDPLGCLRSDHNYPSLISANLGVALKDVSCSGAETGDMFTAQGVTPGPNPAQLDALNADVRVVTLGIGGNDIGFSSIVKNCVKLNPFDAPCRDAYVTASGDQLAQNIAATAPKVADVIQAIHSRSPKAAVLVIGYPTVLPATGDGCWPTVPILPVDVNYLRGVYQQLNAMLATTAGSNGATYVDTATGSVGHDACSSDKWIEGVIPGSSAAPVHPNANGMVGIAAIVQPYVAGALKSAW